MLAGSPLWFFLAEAVVLNLILVLSVRHHDTVTRELVARMYRRDHQILGY